MGGLFTLEIFMKGPLYTTIVGVCRLSASLAFPLALRPSISALSLRSPFLLSSLLLIMRGRAQRPAPL